LRDDEKQALRFQIGQAMAEIALVVSQGVDELRIAGAHGAPCMLCFLPQSGQDTPLQAGETFRSHRCLC
jgi:hypothetical protein